MNLSPDAHVFIQLIPITRQQEGLLFIPLSAEMFQSSGRRQVEALLAEQDPHRQPGTRKNRGVLEADKFSPMTQWSLGFAGKGDVLLDGTKAKERMETDPLTCPNLTNTFETENSTFESRLATCAVGQDTRQACIRCTNEVGHEARVHFANINAWFEHYFHGIAVGGPDIEQFDVVAAILQVYAIRSHILWVEALIEDLMSDYHHVRAVNEVWNYE